MDSKRKPNLICDTMIWYYIGNGSIDPKSLDDYNLISTGVNIQELSTTENLKDDFKSVKKAIAALNQYSTVIPEDPFDYMISENVNLPYTSPTRKWHLKNLQAFEGFMDGEYDDLFEGDIPKEKFQALIDEWHKPVDDFIKNSNAGLETTLKKGKATYGSKGAYKSYLRKNKHSYVEIMLLFKNIFSAKIGVAIDELDYVISWDDMELLFRVWDEYYKDLVLRGNAKFTKQDHFDLLNMAYVKKGDFYLTCEKKRWIGLIEKNDETKKYLIDFECPE